jgi:nucleoside-diphosphate-sugar epimerase
MRCYWLDETAPLAPETEYARSKVDAERAVRCLADDRFSPTFCRNGTIYGLSPRMRFDTVLNDFMGTAFTTGSVEIHSNGMPSRPVVHVQDVARAFQAVLEAPLELVHNEAFNTGSDELNHQIRDLGQIVAKWMRWGTNERKIERWERVVEEAKEEHAIRVARLLGRT